MKKKARRANSTLALIGPFVAGGLCLAWTVLVACSTKSSSSSGQCNDNPWQCSAGQTCWPTDNNPTPDFGCIASTPGAKPGDPCHESPGTATCGDFMLCDQIGAAGGICALYCDSAHNCPNGYVCAQL